MILWNGSFKYEHECEKEGSDMQKPAWELPFIHCHPLVYFSRQLAEGIILGTMH